jgi:hypothetical protein
MSLPLLDYVRVAGPDPQMIWQIGLDLFVGAVAISLLLRLLRLFLPGLATLLAVLFTAAVCPFTFKGLFIALPLLLAGLWAGKSTRILASGYDRYPPMRLSPFNYHQRMHELRLLSRTGEFNRVLLNPSVDWPTKMDIQVQVLTAYVYRRAASLALIMSLPYLWFWSMLNAHSDETHNVGPLVFMLGLPYGYALGTLVKFIEGSRLPPARIGGTVFKPTLSSFLSSLAWSFSPASIATLALLWMPAESTHKLLFIIPTTLMFLFSALLFLQDIHVHRTRFILFNDGIASWSARLPYGVKWHEIKQVVIHERPNLRSGVDRLLQVQCLNGRIFAYPLSVLSKADQNRILIAVRRHAPNTETYFDKGVL